MAGHDLPALPFLAARLAPPVPAPDQAGGAAAHSGADAAEETPERKVGREDDREHDQRDDQDDGARLVQVVGHPLRQPRAGRPAGREVGAVNAGRADGQRQERADTAEEQRHAERLRVGGVDGGAPEAMPADEGEHDRHQVRGVPEQLVAHLGHERADPADEVRGGQLAARAEEPHRVRRIVGDQGDEPGEREGEQRDPDELAHVPRHGG